MFQTNPRFDVIVTEFTRQAGDRKSHAYPLERRWFLFGVLSLCLWMGAGCSSEVKKDVGPTGTVSGVVKVKGAPLTSGRVNFTKAEGDAGGSGAMGQGGQYKLDEPIPVGEYTVFISFEFSPEAMKLGEGMTEDVLKIVDSVPKKYRNPKTSKVSKSVKEGTNEISIELK